MWREVAGVIHPVSPSLSIYVSFSLITWRAVLAGRPQQRILTPGRRKPGKARYREYGPVFGVCLTIVILWRHLDVLKSDTVTWDYICPSKNGDDPETLPFLNITSHTEQPNMPLVWAAVREQV